MNLQETIKIRTVSMKHNRKQVLDARNSRKFKLFVLLLIVI